MSIESNRGLFTKVPENAPNIILNPITPEGKRTAFDAKTRQAWERFSSKANNTRRLFVSEDTSAETRAYGNKLSPNTAIILEGFMGVERFIPDYARWVSFFSKGLPGYEEFGKVWIPQENDHGDIIEEILLDSEVRTQEEIDKYNQRRTHPENGADTNIWLPHQHKGADSSAGLTVFATFQERRTYVDYLGAIVEVRRDYGLPDKPTEWERKRGKEIGAVGSLRDIAGQEIIHHGFYLDLTNALAEIYPDETAEVIKVVYEGFIMPASGGMLPESTAFLKALIRAGMVSRNSKQEKLNPVLRALGIKLTDIENLDQMNHQQS